MITPKANNSAQWRYPKYRQTEKVKIIEACSFLFLSTEDLKIRNQARQFILKIILKFEN